MIQYKQDIRCADFESAVKRTIEKVDALKHATPQAKDEFYRLLISMRDSLIKWETHSIEVPEFMRETR